MKKWKCIVCGYIHEGDNPPESCPICGVGPESFELVGEVEDKGPIPAAEKDDVKKAIYKMSYGMYIITSLQGEKINGQACNTAFQITSDPMRVAVGINKNNLTGEFILESKVFAINILGQEAHDLIRRFGYRSGREFDKFEGINYSIGKTGSPLLNDTMGYLECQVIPDKIVDCGTHRLFIADVVAGKLLSDEEPMTYAYYRKTK